VDRNGRPRRRPDAPSVPTTITELARRYHSCAVALSRALGIPMSETFVLQFHNAISSIFIASDRAGVRLASGVQLPPLGGLAADATHGQALEPEEGPPSNGYGATAPRLVAIPTDAGLPCAGQVIPALKPAQLAMLISKTARLLHDEGERWVALLHALESERNARVERGRKATRSPEANGDVP
jgi:hypothetical protein